MPIRMSTLAGGGPLQDFADLGLGPEPADDLDRERELGHPRGEAAVVLLGQDRGRHQHGDLLAGVDRLERRPDGDLGLAVADVAADQAIHRLALGHVALDRLDGRELVGRLLVGKGRLELGHPVAVLGRDRRIPGWLARWAWMSISSCARSTTASATRFFRFSQVDEPIFESVGLGLAAADVLLHQVDLGDRDVELGPLGELEEQRLLGVLGRLVDEAAARDSGRCRG